MIGRSSRSERSSKRRVLASDVNPALLARALKSASQAMKDIDSTTEKRPNKYGNEKTSDGYDSKKEKRVTEETEALVRARASGFENVSAIRKQVAFTLIPTIRGDSGKVLERSVKYVADLVLDRADGSMSVYDLKSEITRKNRAYVIKRKLMLHVHGLRIIEC